MLEHLGLQVLEHHVRVAQAVVRRHALQRLVALVLSRARRAPRDLAVECHDRAERVALRDQAEFARGLLVVLAESLHLLLFHRYEGLSEEVSDGHTHDLIPDTLTVVEDARILFLLLGAIEETALESHQKVLEDPFEELPAHKVIFIHEKLGMLLRASREGEPLKVLDAELLKHGDSGKGLKPIELDELEDFLSEHLAVLTLHEAFREDVSNKLGEEIGHVPVVRGATLE